MSEVETCPCGATEGTQHMPKCHWRPMGRTQCCYVRIYADLVTVHLDTCPVWGTRPVKGYLQPDGEARDIWWDLPA